MVSQAPRDDPSVPAKKAHNLSDFSEFLQQLYEEGFEFVVIGGCAVSAYASVLGDELYSVDLDLLAGQQTLVEILDWANEKGLRIVKRPRPRNLPVAFLEAADGKEVNILTSSTGLPSPEVAIRAARLFSLSSHGDLEVPVADPFDLLSNKLSVAREKDLPHIELLRRFVDQEAILAFSEETAPRARLAPARRLLEVLGRPTLPTALADRLIELAKTSVDFRFLVNTVPTKAQALQVLQSASAEVELQEQLDSILARRNFS